MARYDFDGMTWCGLPWSLNCGCDHCRLKTYRAGMRVVWRKRSVDPSKGFRLTEGELDRWRREYP